MISSSATDSGKGPLAGKRVLVTRSRAQASALSKALEQLGAEAVELPTIQVEPMEDYSALDSAIGRLESYGWLVFTSVNGVAAFFERLAVLGKESRALRQAQGRLLKKAKVCAIGPATAEALRQRGVEPAYVPPQYVLEAIVDGFRRVPLEGARVLLPRAEGGRQVLAEGLARLGAQVDEVAVYRTVAPAASRARLRAVLHGGKIDVVTFTSSSTVRHLLELLEGDFKPLERALVACIGPVTAKTARDAGLRVDIVAQEYTIPGLVRALVEHFSQQGGG